VVFDMVCVIEVVKCESISGVGFKKRCWLLVLICDSSICVYFNSCCVNHIRVVMFDTSVNE